jgi:hypothetical protein
LTTWKNSSTVTCSSTLPGDFGMLLACEAPKIGDWSLMQNDEPIPVSREGANSFQREIVDRAVLSLKDAGVPSFLIE